MNIKYKTTAVPKVLFSGEITKTIAREAGIKPGIIVVTDWAINHIIKNHEQDFALFKIDSPSKFISNILNNFNEIAQGNSGKLLLGIKKDKKVLDVLIIEFKYKNNFYEVVTAYIKNVNKYDKFLKLWIKK